MSLIPSRPGRAAGPAIATAAAALVITAAICAVSAVSAVPAGAVTGSGGRPARPQALRAVASGRVNVRHTRLGSVLVDARGFTLYAFGRDGARTDRCVHISGCAGVWPVLRTRSRPVAGSGVRRPLLGSIALPGGGRQITYAGHPLYGYAGDTGPGQTSYVGVSQFGGVWYAVTPAGRLLR